MTTDLQPVPDTGRFTAAHALQSLLPELIALSLDAKQAHWNATGPMFLPLHEMTDEIARDAHSWADRIAERAVALGFTTDARPRTVAAVAGPFPAGPLADHEAIAELVNVINGVIKTGYRALDALDQTDPVSYDLTVEMLAGIEKYCWMLRAQLVDHLSIPVGDARVWPDDAS